MVSFPEMRLRRVRELEPVRSLIRETRLSASRTVTPAGASDRARQLLQEGVDVVTFTSSSTVRNLMELLGGDKELLASSLIACIGPVTAGAAAELGLRVDLVAKVATVEGLVEALVSHWERSQQDLSVRG